MLSKADEYRQMIQEVTERIILFPHAYNQENRSNGTLQCNIKLPSLHPFRSSQEIQNNMLIIHQITHQSSQQYPTSLHNNWPKSCIGLVLCQHHQNNQTYYVYGTGILIHEKIVLTSAKNVYCRRLNTQYTNVRFIVGICGDKCSGIYDVMRLHYPKEYTMKEYKNYNFAVLQLYNDLSNSCGYVGWKTACKPALKKLIAYEYVNTNQKGQFNLRQIKKLEKETQYMQSCLGSGVLVQENKDNQCSIVGLQQSEKKYILSEKIRNRVNQWTENIQINFYGNQIGTEGCKYLSQANWIHLTSIILRENNIGAQGCKYLSQINWTHLTIINLYDNKIDAQGCKYLSQANWIHLAQIYLERNNIDAQGCKYLSQANWIHLRSINLQRNYIDAQGCKYLSQANWIHLAQIYLERNYIDAQGCKYLIQANWIHLRSINLQRNNIDAQGCKYLSQINWTHLTIIKLYDNKIDAQGCKYLSQANWIHLAQIYLGANYIDAQGCKYLIQANWINLRSINLYNNKIGAQGCKYLIQANWIHLRSINLDVNNIDAQGCNYLSQSNWTHLISINLFGNKIDDIIYRLLLQQPYPNTRIYI